MGLCSSVTGAGLGFATYEAMTVAYRNHVGHSPSPGERGALAGVTVPTAALCFNSEVPLARVKLQ